GNARAPEECRRRFSSSMTWPPPIHPHHELGTGVVVAAPGPWTGATGRADGHAATASAPKGKPIASLPKSPVSARFFASDAVVDTHRQQGVIRGAGLAVNALEDLAVDVAAGGDLPGENAGVARLGIVLGAFRQRKLIATLGTATIAGSDQAVALR
ncbi:MAG: hypothetical protein RMJ52_14855, partial [Gemmataceae bacterium]|nr:hypothetical protein [Gemmataceae bacterium]